ncbi:hypothetical protein NONO_c74860 [Nocardia nova SH22a]|uniref:Uncharacterized protein n=1 Tax=Nocardia nova SH22a TaxID=1415166 RepID=W5TYC2_9NOCA|nr:hypothetical protein [Nocardia nova]AHH22241.1 hypothetical protein NONO_c74860 [Nocardia nova SH22a]
MLFSPLDDALLVPPGICGLAQADLAHDLMRRHRDCRAERCAWKQVAYRTLVQLGRIEPPNSSSRERAHRHGIEFPYRSDVYGVRERTEATAETFQQVLDGLKALANDMSPNDSRDR